MSNIKSMKLYTHVERIENELAELGRVPADELTVDELSAFDQLHYHGTDALDHALQRLSAAPDQHWLEIGSGIGGPARYLAQHGRLQMTALELQPDQNGKPVFVQVDANRQPVVDGAGKPVFVETVGQVPSNNLSFGGGDALPPLMVIKNNPAEQTNQHCYFFTTIPAGH